VDLDSWHASGERRRIGGHDMFVRVAGDGPWLTLLHGFPSSSWDYAKLVPLLSGFRTLALDFLGFGNSDKPRGKVYSIAGQADLVVAAWEALGVARTAIVAHDYGDSVTAELLARALPITGVVFLNGAIYGDLNELLLVQKLLRLPGAGAVITRFISERLFRKSFVRVFGAEGMPSDAELHDHWRAICLRGGNTLYHRLVHHYGEIVRDHARLGAAIEKSAVPRHFVWGSADPVSRISMIERARQRCEGATFVELPGVCHYPHVEAPDAVATEVMRRLAG
jgi:pimeloyl-ACP methyl ester carboxylesterase